MVVVSSSAVGAFYCVCSLFLLVRVDGIHPAPVPDRIPPPPGLSRLLPSPLGVEWCAFSPIVCDGVKGLVLALRLHRVAVVGSEFILIRVRHHYSYRFWSRLGHLFRMMLHAH